MTQQFKQRLVIRIENGDESSQEAVYEEKEGIGSHEIFWEWFINVWPMLGLEFIKRGIQEKD